MKKKTKQNKIEKKKKNKVCIFNEIEQPLRSTGNQAYGHSILLNMCKTKTKITTKHKTFQNNVK